MTDEKAKEMVKLVKQLFDNEVCNFMMGYDIAKRRSYKRLCMTSWEYMLKHNGQPTTLYVEICPNGIYEVTRTIDNEGNQLYCLLSTYQFGALLHLPHEECGKAYIFK